jgi:glycosyltransferase involved in cell wall biosynthesis
MKQVQAPSVFGWAADQAGCGYYRLGLPLYQLERQFGLKVAASTHMIRAVEDRADVIVGQRICLEGATKVWDRMSKAGKRLIFEIDDDLWHIHPANQKPYEFFNSPNGMLERLTANVRRASMVTVTNESLAEVVREMNENVYVLPNYIDEELLTWERPRRDKITIGWSGSFTHDIDFAIVRDPLRRFFRQNPEVGMHFIGQNYADLIQKADADHSEWTEEVIDYQKSIDFDIGIIPLKYDKFNNSKSYIKALEYAALGIPVVASDTGPYRDFVKHGVTGFLVGADHMWNRHLRDLLNDEAMREEMGAAARDYAANFTIQRNAVQWLQVYSSLMPTVEE